jgi:hypothetical protein
MDLGVLALGKNRTSVNPHNGLQLRCNNFDDGEFDVYIPPTLHGQINNLGVHQGYYSPSGANPTENKDLAGNLFSHSSSSPGFWDFENNDNTHFVAYYHHDPSSNSRVYPRDDHRLNVVASKGDFDYIPLVSCPSEITESENTATIRSSMRNDLQMLDDDRQLLDELLDGGSTPELIAQIFTTPSSENYDLYVDLINQSPYLSDEVLIEIITRDGFPDILLRNILIENPQSVHHQNVWDAVVNRTPPLPQYMIDDILNGTDYVGALQLLKGRMTHHRMNAHQKATRLTRLYGREYVEGELVNNPLDSLLLLYDELDEPHLYLRKAKLLNYMGLSGVNDALQAAVNHPMLEEEEMKDEFEAYTDIYQVMFAWEGDSLTSGQITTLQGIVQQDFFGASTLAHFMLDEVGAADSMLVDPTYYPTSSINKRRQRGPVEKGAKPVLNRFRLYPNPASEFTTLHYQLSGVGGTLEYDLLDMSGRSLYKGSFKAKVEGAELIEIPRVASGMYLLRITKNGKEVVGTEKLEIYR